MSCRWDYNFQSRSSILEQIIRNRELNESFFHATMRDVTDLSVMKDIEKAAERVIEAVHKKQKIMIYGHDDVDGISSTYILFNFLEKLGSQNHYYFIPNRLTDDHGLQPKFIEKVKEKGIELVITVDGGISCFEVVKEIQENICDIIITDHHLVQNKLPAACAVVNPKRPDCDFPDKMIAGVGVTYFLLKTIAAKLDIELDRNYLFWVAAGTIADKVPLKKINRIFVKEVLENWYSFDSFNIKRLCDYFGSSYSYFKRIRTIHLINRFLSNGRREDGENLSLAFLLAIDKEKDTISNILFAEMKAYEDTVFELKNVLNQLTAEHPQYSFVYFDEKELIPVEFLGFSAGYIAKQFKIPVVMLKKKNRSLMAEARCTEGFNLVKAFRSCKEHLIQYGGHARAAGFTIEQARLSEFTAEFEKYVNEHKKEIEDNKKIVIDAVLSIDEINKLDDYLKMDYNILQPFGQGNPNPKFLVKNYKPRRDYNKIRLNTNGFPLDRDDHYDVIMKFQGNTFDLIDFRKTNHTL